MRTPAATGVTLIRIESTIVPASYCARIWSTVGDVVVRVKNTESAFTESMMPYCGKYQNWLWQKPVAGTSSKQKSGTLLGCVTATGFCHNQFWYLPQYGI